MEKVLLYQMDSLYRDSFKIYGYHFGGNEKTVCIVGAIRGNEIQQLYMRSNLIKTLKLLEERRCLDENLGIMNGRYGEHRHFRFIHREQIRLM